MKTISKTNIYLFSIIFIFFIISILSISSAVSILPKIYHNLYLRQIMWYIIGILCFFIVKNIGNERIYRYSTYIYFLSCVFLFILLLSDNPVNNVKSWIYIGNISFQPSEFSKLALILIISNILNQFHFKENIKSKDEFKLIIKIFLITTIPSILTFLQPDTSSAITYFFIAFIMIFISGIKRKWFIITFSVFIILISLFNVLYSNFPNVFSNSFYYRVRRIVEWRENSGMQLENSMIAIGTAGLTGYGYDKTPIYIPEPHTDFIFSIYTSNFGLIGAFLLVLLIIIFDLFILNISFESIKTIDKYLIGGILASIIYNQVQNLSMTIGILPITGIPLPFISYGGSSLMIYFTMISLCINSLKLKKWNA